MLLLLLLVQLVRCSSAVEVKRPRGVSLSNHHFYEEVKPFTCLDGSLTIAFDRVNDDYCDCADGSDEPGTAACPNGRFHCTNAGYRPQYIPSSRVNDGICDCCDTTDEYNSGHVCENTCREMGRKAREALQQMVEVAKEGFHLKQILIEEAKKGQEEKQGKLTELQESKQSLEEQVAALKALKEEAEKPEEEAKNIHKKAWEEQKAAERAEREKLQAARAFQELDQNQDGLISAAELQSHPELDIEGDGVVSEVDAQTLLGDLPHVAQLSFQEKVWPLIRDKYLLKASDDIPPAPPLEVPPEEGTESHPEIPEEHKHSDDGEDEEEDEDEDDEEDGDQEEPKIRPPKQAADKTEEEAEPLPPYDEATQALIDVAQKAREKYEDAAKSLRDMEDSIRALEKEISFDFGPQGEFTYLYNQCYELSTNEYVYRLCPFDRVTQKPKNGGSETNLGIWGSWAGPSNDKFSIMKYDHGTGCWQGPNRSTNVKLSCGKETVVISTAEPSRCEYLMELSSPAACQEPRETDVSDHDEL
ncbi:glucosidase 2 subunit beta isoform X2 [Microcaecilia unicolor]|uniref:Glucosidase 2 subunit beta n=1 Tax=Microcaecilia unicolor TaxID=1415580 RepID=A0A6P7XK23_9AMPH|nr:glucosidase 2 subunit beta isoform X2 [Microcaecilia unicolor]